MLLIKSFTNWANAIHIDGLLLFLSLTPTNIFFIIGCFSCPIIFYLSKNRDDTWTMSAWLAIALFMKCIFTHARKRAG